MNSVRESWVIYREYKINYFLRTCVSKNLIWEIFLLLLSCCCWLIISQFWKNERSGRHVNVRSMLWFSANNRIALDDRRGRWRRGNWSRSRIHWEVVVVRSSGIRIRSCSCRTRACVVQRWNRTTTWWWWSCLLLLLQLMLKWKRARARRSAPIRCRRRRWSPRCTLLVVVQERAGFQRNEVLTLRRLVVAREISARPAASDLVRAIRQRGAGTNEFAGRNRCVGGTSGWRVVSRAVAARRRSRVGFHSITVGDHVRRYGILRNTDYARP